MDQATGYQRLGLRTYLVFLLRGSWMFILFAAALAFLTGILFVVPQEYSATVTTVLWFGGFLALLALLGTAGVAWLEYIHYGVRIGETDFRFRRGIVSEDETGIPYRRIGQVNISRSPLELAFGVSTLTITIADDEDSGPLDTIRIPALDKQVAIGIQEELLRRAQIEHVQIGGGETGPNKVQ